MERLSLLLGLWLLLWTHASASGDASPAIEARLRQATLELDRLRGNLDPQAHARAAKAVKSLAVEAPQHPRTIALQAWLEMNAHAFAEGLALADKALAIAPREPVSLALRTDALTELGRYAEAEVAAEALDATGVGQPARLRIAHLRRLNGDIQGALELVTAAVERSPPRSPDYAWLLRELAALHWHGGQDAAALALLETLPEEDREALLLRARIVESGGNVKAAHAIWLRAVEVAPLAAALVGAWRTADDTSEQRRLAHQLEGMARLDEDQGGLSRRDFIEFFARSGRLDEARRLAHLEYERRPDVFSAAQRAWVFALAGEREAAGLFAREAARLGTVDRDVAAQLAAVRASDEAAGK